MNKRIKKKRALYEHIEVLENRLTAFVHDTAEVVEILTNKIHRLEKQAKKHGSKR